jgi:hypothetical protein
MAAPGPPSKTRLQVTTPGAMSTGGRCAEFLQAPRCAGDLGRELVGAGDENRAREVPFASFLVKSIGRLWQRRLLLLAGVDQGWLCGILNGAVAPASMTWVVPVT